MPYKLKSNVPDIEIVDGPFAGRKFVAGEIYAEIPPGDEKQFDIIRPAEEPAGKRNRTEKPEVTDA